MATEPRGLGRPLRSHPIEPRHVQRAVIVAVVSFSFFLAMLLAFSFRGHFGYLLLAGAFFVVYAFTMVGWWLQRKKVVTIYENGLTYGKFSCVWSGIEGVSANGELPDMSLSITARDGKSVVIPSSIADVEAIFRHIGSKIETPTS